VVVPWLVPEVSLPTWASGGQEALDLGKVLRRRALRGVGGVEPGLGRAGGERGDLPRCSSFPSAVWLRPERVPAVVLPAL
jgi:hypothetical protein